MTFLGGFIAAFAVASFIMVLRAWCAHNRSKTGIGAPMLWQIGQFNKNRNHQRKDRQ